MGYSDVEPQNMTVDLNSPVAGTSVSLDDEFDEQPASRPHASAPASATTPATRPKRLIMLVFFIWFEPFLSLHRHSGGGASAFEREHASKHAKTTPRTHEGTVRLCQMQNERGTCRKTESGAKRDGAEFHLGAHSDHSIPRKK